MESQNLSIQYIKQQPRWDFRYFEPKYLEAERIIKSGKYPAERLGKYVESIVNFGAYSLCNLLEWVDKGIPYIRVTDLKEDGINWETVPHIPLQVHQQLPKSRVFSGDVLYSMAGTIGLAVVAPEGLGECNSNQAIAKIRLHCEELNPYYLAAFLNSKLGRYQSERIANGQTVLNINLGEIGLLYIPIPPRSIQLRIAEIIQEAYTARKTKRAEAEALLKSIDVVILDALGISKDWPQDERKFIVKRSMMHRTDVRYFSPFYSKLEELLSAGKYKAETLANACEKVTNGFTPARSEYLEQGNPIIKVASIKKDWRIAWEQVSFVSELVFEKAAKAHIQGGDLLILSASHQLDYIGRNFALVRDMPVEYEGRCMAVGELIIARANTKIIIPGYLLACFTIKHIQELTNRLSRGQTAHLYPNDLGTIRIPIPPKDVQRSIVAELEERRIQARLISMEGDRIVAQAKAHIERLFIGEEETA